jgi:diphthamide biosynthesis enzyme Dph1/Dph2-like protein
MKEKLENLGKKVYIAVIDEVKNDKFLGIKVDFLINFACPRIIEDKFDLPILNARDIWENLEKLKL